MSQLFKYFGFDRLVNLWKMAQQYGGLGKAFLLVYRTDDIKPGVHIGNDKYGNKYYENRSYFFGRSRWVNYAEYRNLEYDASQVPAEWYGWLHHKTDLPPHKDKNRPKYKWIADHTENLTGTEHQYMPYNTTRPKIQAWNPKGAKDGCKK